MSSKSNFRICCALYVLHPIMAFLDIPAELSITSLLFVLVYLYFFFSKKDFKESAFSLPLVIWLILTIYHWINGMAKKVPEVDVIDLLHGLKIYSCIAIFCYFGKINFKQTVYDLVKTFTVYLIIAFFICDFNNEEGRMSGVLYATGLGQTAGMYSIYLVYYSHLKNYGLGKTSVLFVLPFLVVLLTQSRNSMALLTIAYVTHIIDFSFLRTFTKNKRRSLFLLGLLFCLFLMVIAGSSLMNRFTDVNSRYTESYSYLAYSTGGIFDLIVGDRLTYYVVGWMLFEDSPLTGIGLWNYRWVTMGEYPLHTEYMVHLCEGGLIAFVLYAYFEFLVFNIIRKYKQNKSIQIIAFSSICIILICGIWARVFFYEFFYPVYGLAISLAYQKNGSITPLQKNTII